MYSKLEELLKKKGVTAYRVAKDLEISPGTLGDWKHGRSRPKYDKLKKLADYFGVTVEYFMD